MDALASAGIDARVHTIIYSHHHLDHVRGALALDADNIIAHRAAPDYWESANAVGVAAPTQLIEGPYAVEIGGTRFEFSVRSRRQLP